MKFYVLSKKQIVKITSVVMALAAVLTVTALAQSGGKRLPIYCVETEKKEIAISFDAAWGCDDTKTLIDILAEYDVPATFFVVGQWVQRYPEAVKMLSDAGHSIQNHSSTHPKMSGISAEAQAKEIKDCNELIKQITGVCPTLFRAPYGDYNNTLIETTESLGMYTIQWDVDSLDWKDSATPQSIAERVISKTQNGSIILCHNDAEHTPEALPTILETLKNDGYEFVFIEDLILKENYEIKHDGTQCKIKDGAE